MPRRVLQGTVVSDKGDKTVIVRVERRLMHPVYKKYIRMSKRYAAHDEDNGFHTGDRVMIEESRPISKRKRWRVVGRLGETRASRAATAGKVIDDTATDTGASTAAALETEAPGAEAPGAEAPGVEAPGAEAPKAETSETETSEAEAPDTEAPEGAAARGAGPVGAGSGDGGDTGAGAEAGA